MNIDNFQYEHRHLGGFVWEVFLINSQKIKFGGNAQSPHPPPKELVYQAFMQNPKQFWIEIEVAKSFI